MAPENRRLLHSCINQAFTVLPGGAQGDGPIPAEVHVGQLLNSETRPTSLPLLPELCLLLRIFQTWAHMFVCPCSGGRA